MIRLHSLRFPSSSSPSRPPPPHDPTERVVLPVTASWGLSGWEVRVFASDDIRQAYLEEHGMTHLQLWHPEKRVSVLTASPLTGGLHEAFPVEGGKHGEPCWQRLARVLEWEHQIKLPDEAVLATLAYLQRTRPSWMH